MKWNNKDVSKEKMNKILADPKTKVESLSLEFSNPEKDKTKAPSMEGFSIDKELILGMAMEMDRINGTKMTLSFDNCSTIMNKSIKIIMTTPDHKED
jgi:hypothetical protein